MDKLVIGSQHDMPKRLANFDTLTDALDYAAQGTEGFFFHDARGRLIQTLSFSELRQRARALARRLLTSGLSRGDRVAAIADTDPEFCVIFFACQYAGLVPVALPISLHMGGRGAYVQQLRGLLREAKPALAAAPEELLPFLREATEDMPWVPTYASEDLESLPDGDVSLVPGRPDEIAYLQFTSGSTSFPRGVVIRQDSVMSNLQGVVRTGLKIQPGDRAASWLPFYHDMGLVGFMLGPMVSQVSVDYLRTRDFAVRPLTWLRLISENRVTIAFGPPVAYHLCTQRLRPNTLEGLDLSSWRIAGVGAEMIRPKILADFASALEPAGFDPCVFMPCYGLAESTLAVTFSPASMGVRCERVDATLLAEQGIARLSDDEEGETREVVNCGRVLPGHEIRICDGNGQALAERMTGRVLLRGPSVMDGYLANEPASRAVLDTEDWLDTGDLGYLTEEGLFITGRVKDLIIINGRNIWPQDLEYLAEQEPVIRVGDASAFAVTREDGDTAVVVIQCRLTDEAEREALVTRVQASVYEHFGFRCIVDLVPRGALPKTSSGKLSRAEARKDFERRAKGVGREAHRTSSTAF